MSVQAALKTSKNLPLPVGHGNKPLSRVIFDKYDTDGSGACARMYVRVWVRGGVSILSHTSRQLRRLLLDFVFLISPSFSLSFLFVGTISASEFKSYCYDMGTHLTDEEVAMAIRVRVRGCGSVCVCVCVRARHSLPFLRTFEAVSLITPGKLTVSLISLTRTLADYSLTFSLYQIIDRDGSGVINYDEFHKWYATEDRFGKLKLTEEQQAVRVCGVNL